MQLRAGLGGLGGRQVVGAAAYEDAGDIAGREGVEEVDLLEPDVLELVALQTALKEEGLVLLLRRLDLRTRGYHDKGFHGAHLIGRVRDLPGPVARAAAEAKIGEITNLVGQLPDTSDTKSYKRDVNTFIGTFRSYLAGQEKTNEVIDDFNDTVNTSNRVDLNELDGGKK